MEIPYLSLLFYVFYCVNLEEVTKQSKVNKECLLLSKSDQCLNHREYVGLLAKCRKDRRNDKKINENNKKFNKFNAVKPKWDKTTEEKRG